MDAFRPLPRSIRRRRLLAAVLLAALGLLGGGGPSWAQPPQTPASPPKPEEELLVGFRAGVSDADGEKVYLGHGAVKIEKLRGISVHRVRVPAQALQAILQALAKRPEVKFVEQNKQVPGSLTPNDPFYGNQWHLKKIAAPAAWDVTQGTASIIIAILDSGVDPTHPDLASKLTPGFNFVSNSTNTSDWFGHGTPVAGAAAASGNNGVGVAGVAWQNKIMPVVVSDTTGFAFFSTLANGLTWAADNGARVANMSFIVAGSSTVTAAAQYALSKGVVVVASAGNCACVDATPENPYIISVSATTQEDGFATFSSQGNFVDISAPGVAVVTTANGGGYLNGQGTSLSSPIVAGVAALMLSSNTALSPSDIRSLLLANADDLGTGGWDPKFGQGRVNAGRAVAAAKTSVPAAPVPPTVAIASPTAGATTSGGLSVGVTAVSTTTNVASVDLYVDGNYFASDVAGPYSFFLNTTTLTNGSHSLQARASDPSGNVGNSTPVSFSVNNVADTTPPTVAIASVVKAKNQVSVGVSATDNVGVTKVELWVDGKLGSTLTSAPYNFTVNLAKLTTGTHALEARAYDAGGNLARSPTSSFAK